jgi:hypothetical protein
VEVDAAVVLVGYVVADPSRWKRAEPEKNTRDRVFGEFKTRSGRQVISPDEAEKAVDLHYTVKHLVQLANHADLLGRRLVTVSLDPKLNKCDGPSEPAWRPNWFMLPGDEQPPVSLARACG